MFKAEREYNCQKYALGVVGEDYNDEGDFHFFPMMSRPCWTLFQVGSGVERTAVTFRILRKLMKSLSSVLWNCKQSNIECVAINLSSEILL